MSQEIDEKIMDARAKIYGPVNEQFETIGEIWKLMNLYFQKLNEGNNLNATAWGHLSALDMVIVKMIRSIANPYITDNYIDARNYITIAENIAKKGKNKAK